MESENDPLMEGILIQLEAIERRSRKFAEEFARQMAKADARHEFMIRRLVKAEARMEAFDKKLGLSIVKLDQSVKDQQAANRRQSKINENFLRQIRKNGHK